MKAVIFTVDHVYANYLVKQLINKYQNKIALIVESDVILNNKSSFAAIKKYLEVSGFYYVAAQVIKLEIYKFLKKIADFFNMEDSKFYSYKNKAKELNIKVIKSTNVNTPDFEKKLKKIKPDLLISVLFNQILKANCIKIPPQGVINFHPAFLPDYKGMSPVFWALANKEKFAGAAVHYIDNGIDTGGIIKRKKIEINKEDSEDSLYWRSVKLGKDLLISSIEAINNKKAKTISNKNGSYFSLPSKEAVKKLKKSKRNFFDLSYYLFQN